MKRTGVGGKGRVSHSENVYNWCPCPVCAGWGVCGAHMQARERGLCACVCESTHLSRPRRSKRVGTEIKGKIK